MNWITLTDAIAKRPLRVNLDQLQTYEEGSRYLMASETYQDGLTMLHFANTIGGESRRYVVEDCDTITQRIEDLT